MIKEAAVQAAINKLTKKHPADAERAAAGVRQAAALWDTRKDGPAAGFKRFCADRFVPAAGLDGLLKTFESKLESADGHFNALLLKLRREMDEDTGPLGPVDAMFAAYSPGQHFSEDMFLSKLAFVVLLNFPARTLDDCLKHGQDWSRAEWARMRLAQRFSKRVPPEVTRAVYAAYAAAGAYIASYNVHLDCLTGPGGKKIFPGGPKLISHWGLRDQLKSLYAEGPGAVEKQRVIRRVLERIVAQEIPADAVDSGKRAWDPEANTLDGAAARREPDTRYERMLGIFRAQLKEDPYFPQEPSHMDRRFKLDREIPEAEVEGMFTALLDAPAGAASARLIAARLGRPLETFDIWYDGFKARASVPPSELDKLTAAAYPDGAAFQAAIPDILRKLGFAAETANFVGERIQVDAARGSGHAWGARMRTEKARLRTRVAAGGMKYLGFNIAMHELGHCVEQVFSLCRVDHTLLAGVPNTAFTEGFAFVFQDRDLQVLGLPSPGGEAVHLKALDTFWATREIAGVALVDMRVWRWLYANKEAEPADLRAAIMRIAGEVWDKYYAPLLGAPGCTLLAVYSHMIQSGLYLPDYPLGHIIAFQVEEYFKGHKLAEEMERMCVLGSITPHEWMHRAVGAGISPEPMMKAAATALAALGAPAGRG
jgi:hypothetical protein